MLNHEKTSTVYEQTTLKRILWAAGSKCKNLRPGLIRSSILVLLGFEHQRSGWTAALLHFVLKPSEQNITLV